MTRNCAMRLSELAWEVVALLLREFKLTIQELADAWRNLDVG